MCLQGCLHVTELVIMWNHCFSARILCTPRSHALTSLHFWQIDQDLIHATVETIPKQEWAEKVGPGEEHFPTASARTQAYDLLITIQTYERLKRTLDLNGQNNFF